MTTMEIDASARPALDVDRPESAPSQVFYRTVKINGLDVFYREAGPQDAPVILLLHGFPTSSHMFRNLIPALADEFHLIAPDYPGFGYSAAPGVEDFEYTFDHLAEVMEHFIEGVGLEQYARSTCRTLAARWASASPCVIPSASRRSSCRTRTLTRKG